MLTSVCSPLGFIYFFHKRAQARISLRRKQYYVFTLIYHCFILSRRVDGFIFLCLWNICCSHFSYTMNIKNNENLVYTPHNPWEPKLVKNSCPVLGWPISDYIKIYTQRHGN
jgi:hypothetical protein